MDTKNLVLIVSLLIFTISQILAVKFLMEHKEANTDEDRKETHKNAVASAVVGGMAALLALYIIWFLNNGSKQTMGFSDNSGIRFSVPVAGGILTVE